VLERIDGAIFDTARVISFVADQKLPKPRLRAADYAFGSNPPYDLIPGGRTPKRTDCAAAGSEFAAERSRRRSRTVGRDDEWWVCRRCSTASAASPVSSCPDRAGSLRGAAVCERTPDGRSALMHSARDSRFASVVRFARRNLDANRRRTATQRDHCALRMTSHGEGQQYFCFGRAEQLARVALNFWI
jgi:hypothetical protein